MGETRAAPPLPRPQLESQFIVREPQAAGKASPRSIAEEQIEADNLFARRPASVCSARHFQVCFPSQDEMGPE